MAPYNPNILEILKGRFPEREYVLLEEVRNAAGHHATNSADFIAVNLWPSRGLTVTGIEMKRSRSDWLSELKKPAKAEATFMYCDFFYLLTVGDHVCKLEEIPPAWGWLQITGDRVKMMKDAVSNQNVKPIGRHFMCAMLKRASSKEGWIREVDIENRIQAAREAGQKDSIYRHERLQKEHNELMTAVQGFREGYGIDFRNMTWGGKGDAKAKKVGDLVRLLEGSPDVVTGLKNQLENLQDRAKNIHQAITEHLGKLADPSAPDQSS